jgi:hypothetical protein
MDLVDIFRPVRKQTRKDTAVHASLPHLHLSKSNAPKAPEENSDQHRNEHPGPSRPNTSERTKHRGAPSMKMVYSRPSLVSTADQNFFQRSVYSFRRHLFQASNTVRKEQKFLAWFK